MNEALVIRKRLADAAARFIDHYDFALSISGRAYLQALLARAVLRMVREERTSEDDISVAEDHLRELLSAAAGTAAAGTGSGPLASA
jgi:hypothetical protein